MAQGTQLLHTVRRSRLWLAAACTLWCTVANAGIDIEVRGVPEDLRTNVLVYLSLSNYKDDELDAETVERLHNRVDREVKAALRPFGFYSPVVKSQITRPDKDNWRTVIDIDPGEPVIMESVTVRVEGQGEDDPLFRRIVDHPQLRVGDRLRHSAYEQIKGDLQRTAANYGYLEGRLTRSELRVDPARNRAAALLEFETGPRYRFGVTSVEQDVVDEALVRRFMRYQQDEPFDVSDLLRTQFALDDSQYFSTVEVVPGELDREEHVVPVNIRAEPARRDRYSFGMGYGTDSGPRGTSMWDRRRVNERGHRFSVELEAGAETRGLESRYTVPIGDPALEKFSFTTTAEQRELADLDTSDVSVEPGITRMAGRWQNVLFVTAAQFTTDDGSQKQVQNLLVPGISVATVPRGYLGEELFQRGFFAELRGSHSVFGSDEDFLQLHMQLERVFDLSSSWHVLVRGESGSSLVGELSELPGSYRFFAGGDRSVRGFGFNDLSPVQQAKDGNGDPRVDEDGNPILLKLGGRHLLTGTVEVIRDLPRNFGLAAFVDVGNAFDDFGQPPDPDDPDFMEYSVGVGFRWRLPVVTLGVDIAQPLSEPGAGPRLHINFSPKL